MPKLKNMSWNRMGDARRNRFKASASLQMGSAKHMALRGELSRAPPRTSHQCPGPGTFGFKPPRAPTGPSPSLEPWMEPSKAQHISQGRAIYVTSTTPDTAIIPHVCNALLRVGSHAASPLSGARGANNLRREIGCATKRVNGSRASLPSERYLVRSMPFTLVPGQRARIRPLRNHIFII